MRSFTAFTKKEFFEVSRTYKLFTIGSIFVMLGFLNPITAKLIPKLFEMLKTEGMSITITEPSAMDSWIQFFKNIPQIGLIVFVIIFSGSITNELSKGTLVNVLTKGLSRSTVILSKFAMTALIWTVSYFAAFLITYGYTFYFWREDVISVPALLLSAAGLWIFGLFLIALLLLGGVLLKSNYGSLLFAGAIFTTLLFINVIPVIQKVNPVALISDNIDILSKAKDMKEFVLPIVISVITIAGSMAGAIMIFNKKEI